MACTACTKNNVFAMWWYLPFIIYRAGGRSLSIMEMNDCCNSNNVWSQKVACCRLNCHCVLPLTTYSWFICGTCLHPGEVTAVTYTTPVVEGSQGVFKLVLSSVNVANYPSPNSVTFATAERIGILTKRSTLQWTLFLYGMLSADECPTIRCGNWWCVTVLLNH